MHVISINNGGFRIWDKNGNLLRDISCASWFSTTQFGGSPFDPKILYDHFNKRWIMVWLHQNNSPEEGAFLVSVSHDSSALGIWYNWGLDNTLNGGTQSGAWCDYEGVGYDSLCLYMTGRQFAFGGNFEGCKLRIVSKAQLYANTAGQVNWTDLWSIRDPGNTGISPDVIRPTVIWGSPSEYYLMVHGPFNGTNTYVILYKVFNPLTNPSMTGADVPVTQYTAPPPPQQLGGGSLAIESGGQALRNEPTYRNGNLWMVHQVASSTGYSNVRYIRINPATNSSVEDVSFGQDPYYHFYPAIAVDQNLDLVVTYSRCSANDYVGSYFTYKLSSDPPQLDGSVTLQSGQANYVKDFGSGRNRWGDYNGAWIDPSDQNNFWVISQYAASPANTWACQMANLRLAPYSGPYIYTFADSLNFGPQEVNVGNADTLTAKVYNYGSSTLTITNIQNSSPNFHIVSNISYPVNLNSYDSLLVKVLCLPISSGNLSDSLRISCNDPNHSSFKIFLRGFGYVITPVTAGVMYGVESSQGNGALVTINTTTGAGTTVGPTGYIQLSGMSIRKYSGEIYGTYDGALTTLLVRVNSAAGDAYQIATIPLTNVRAIAWDINDDLYFGVTDGRLYKFNISNSDTTFIGNTGISNLYGLAINPLNGGLWGINLSGMLYKISKQNGAATLVGNSNLGTSTSITFDMSSKLYTVKGVGAQISSLYTLDTTTAAATLIGSTGKKGINGIAISPNVIGIQPISNIIPSKFGIYQNYPNPFNPSTKIKFDLPQQSQVRIRVYDILGREVATVVNQPMQAGSYSVTFDASNYSSGIYFYVIDADKFRDVKKMILLK